MRMFRLPSWIAESRGDERVVDGEAAHKMANGTRPVVEIVSGTGVSKRKREGSMEGPDLDREEAHDAKRRKPSSPTHRSVLPEGHVEHAVSGKASAVVAGPSRLREVIESQFSLEILLKHNELRLINQEMAKCQVALEQLRRCHLIPYPTSEGSSFESMANVINGTGPAVGRKEGVPRWAAPYGVTDGPYTRHYAKWLIPDPSFDGMASEGQRGLEGSRAGKTLSEGRATRHSCAEGSTPASKSRSQRGNAGQKLQALSSGYPQAKEKAGPCVLKRGDGQMVKLVCIDCHRENFSSTQGFINHCRIAHRRDFKSHEEAAIASGQPIELDEVGGIVGEEKAPPVANGLVHPLIRSAPTSREAYLSILARIEDSRREFSEGSLPGVTSIPTGADPTPSKVNRSRPKATPSRHFVPSLATPHLSELMRSRGFGGNLNDLVGEAKEQVHFEDLTSQDEESEDSERPADLGHRHLGGLDGASDPRPVMRMPARAGVSPAALARPPSSKGIDGRNGRQPGVSGISPRLSHATPVINTSAASTHSRPTSRFVNNHHADIDESQGADVDVEMMDGPSIVDLSPNTVASNNAPSLVSDDGEYDEGDDAESASSGDDEDSVAEIDIADDGADKVEPRTVLRNRTGSAGDGLRLRKEDKHVTFVSPVKESGNERRARRS